MYQMNSILIFLQSFISTRHFYILWEKVFNLIQTTEGLRFRVWQNYDSMSWGADLYIRGEETLDWNYFPNLPILIKTCQFLSNIVDFCLNLSILVLFFVFHPVPFLYGGKRECFMDLWYYDVWTTMWHASLSFLINTRFRWSTCMA